MPENLINDDLVKSILNLYSSQTGIPITLVIKDLNTWQSEEKYCEDFCKFLHKRQPKKCHEDHIQRSKFKIPKLTICHAGLCNYVVPLKQNGEIIGALLTGQRRIRNKDDKSLAVLKKIQ
ncbi:MAG: PocR ligand-binding domain-containing protein [Methanoregula sp.]|jgi:ligand-binding sensor protein|nr:PocR ligand-binding domain-containing protein [Methanoregula sp.]